MVPPGLEEMAGQLQNMFSGLAGARRKPMKLSVKDAMQRLRDEEAAKLVNEEELTAGPSAASKRAASSSSTRSTRSLSAPSTAARTSRARAYSAICCRSSRAAR